MELRDLAPIGTKTTMRVGGKARLFAELKTREDVEEAVRVATERKLRLIVLGAGANTVFADDVVEAFVVRIKAEELHVEGQHVRVQAGKILASLINELAPHDLDLSDLTGIPGTVGGSLFGNAGQGPKGIWLDAFVESVTAYIDGAWKTFTKEECHFRYRESIFKDMANAAAGDAHKTPILWEAELRVPSRPGAEVLHQVGWLLQKRFETQPHLKTAGSCFKAVGTTPAWQLIDKAGLRGHTIGGVQIAEKHANFLLNINNATYADVKAIVEKVKSTVKEPLSVEMRFYESDGKLAF